MHHLSNTKLMQKLQTISKPQCGPPKGVPLNGFTDLFFYATPEILQVLVNPRWLLGRLIGSSLKDKTHSEHIQCLSATAFKVLYRYISLIKPCWRYYRLYIQHAAPPSWIKFKGSNQIKSNICYSRQVLKTRIQHKITVQCM